MGSMEHGLVSLPRGTGPCFFRPERRRHQGIPGTPTLQRTGGHGLGSVIPGVTGTVTYPYVNITENDEENIS